MLTKQEVKQLVAALGHASGHNINGMPHVSLRAALEILQYYSEVPVTITIDENKINWSFADEQEEQTETSNS